MLKFPHLLLALSFAPSAFATTYSIDPVHTQIIFRIGHLEISGIYGRFNDVSGSFDLDAAGKLSAVKAKVSAKSVDTHNEDRDDDVRTNYLNTKNFSDVTFTSTTITPAGPDSYQVTGNMTLNGQTKAVTLKAKKTGSTVLDGHKRVGADIKFSIKRSDFGLNYSIPRVGDEVQFLINLEGEVP